MVSVNLLKNLNVFKEVPSSALEILAKNMEEKKYEEGAVICREGEPGGILYLIVSGSVSVQKRLLQGEGDTKTVARLKKEEFFGEMAFLQNRPTSATVLAREETVLLSLTRAVLEELISKDPKIALNQALTIMTGLSDRLRSTTSELITVFEVARVVGLLLSAEELAQKVVNQLRLSLPSSVSIGFYRWNVFNNEYSLLISQGPNENLFNKSIESESSIKVTKGNVVGSRIDLSGQPEGLILYYVDEKEPLSPSEMQMVDTIAAVLAPALATARHREEEAARQQLQRLKQQGSYL